MRDIVYNLSVGIDLGLSRLTKNGFYNVNCLSQYSHTIQGISVSYNAVSGRSAIILPLSISDDLNNKFSPTDHPIRRFQTYNPAITSR